MRLHRIPWSTNVGRVELALALKGIAYEAVDHDPADRSAIRALSGQDLVPVLEDGDEVLLDSPVILRHLERRRPDPPLWPADPARAAEADVFVDWFNRVWKVAPNRLAELDGDDPASAAAAAELAASRERFEALLEGRDFLLGDALGIADVTAHPFLRYALGCAPGDDDPFHHVLARHLSRPSPRVRAWIERVREIRAALGLAP